jgi:phage tail-like protein
MATGQRVDPYRNFNFKVEIDGIVQAGFSDCSGFGSSTDPIEYREGGDPTRMRKLPGITKHNNIVLKWGLTDSSNKDLYSWYQNVMKGKIERKNGSIIVLDLEGNEKVRWNFFDAWPTKWDGPDFSGKSNDIAIDCLELTCELIERA